MYVVKYDREPLLGREWINQLKTLEKLKDSLNEVQVLNFIEQSEKSLVNNLLEQFPNLTYK